MPAYCYTTDDGETVDRVYPMGKAPRTVTLPDGRVANRDLAAEHGTKYTTVDACWPMTSRALGCDEGNVQAHKDNLKKHGISVDFVKNKQGLYDMQLTSRAQRRRVLKAMGYHDKDGGYGD